MYVSLFSNPTSPGPDDDHALIDYAVEQLLEADEAGFAALYVTEHHFYGHNTYTDPFMLGSWLAPQLKQAYVAIGVMCAPYHHPLRMVESCNILDVLTKGRCIIGMGPGFPVKADMAPFGIGLDEPKPMTEQRMEVMLKVWDYKEGDPPLQIATDWETGELDGRVSPAPYRKPHPLFGRGTTSDATMIKCAERGMPVMFGIFLGLDDESQRQVALYRDTLAGSGASPETIAECERFIATSKAIRVMETEAEVEEYRAKVLKFHESMEAMGAPRGLWGAEGAKRTQIFGTPDSVAGQMKAFGDLGIGIRCVTMPGQGGPLVDLDEAKRSFRLLIDEVVPQLDPETLPGPPSVEATAEVGVS